MLLDLALRNLRHDERDVFRIRAAKGKGSLAFKSKEVLHTTTAAATNTLSGFIPAGSIVLGVLVHVLDAIPGTLTTFAVGTSGDPDAWGATVAKAAGAKTTSDDFTYTAVPFFGGATDLVLDADSTNQFGAGARIRVVLYYIDLAAVTV